jgi:hypothetical protein
MRSPLTLVDFTHVAFTHKATAASSQQPASSTATSEPCSAASTFEQGQCCVHGVHWALVGTPSMPTVGARCLCLLGTSSLSMLHSLQQGRAHRLCIDYLRWCMASMGYLCWCMASMGYLCWSRWFVPLAHPSLRRHHLLQHHLFGCAAELTQNIQSLGCVWPRSGAGSLKRPAVHSLHTSSHGQGCGLGLWGFGWL